MKPARIQKEIQALGRGDLDVGALMGRVRDILVEFEDSAPDLLDELEDALSKEAITTEHYSRLTEFISGVRGGGETEQLADKTASEGNTVYVGPSDPESVDSSPSATQLATDSGASPDRNQSQVVVGMRLRDRFILDEVVGVGGMGTVYKGRDALKLEAQDRNPYVAVKVLNDSFQQRPDAFIALQREASRQQRLAHPNIATVYDFDRDAGVMFITMEFLDGRTLDQLIKKELRAKGGMKLPEALPIIEDLCAALAHAHARNVVHADFKPGNCFLTESNHVKVLDFGIARAMKDPNAAVGDETLFDPRSIGALTPAYASPEMITGSHDADPRDDIYALACVTYELLTGRHPFHRVPSDQAMTNELKPARIKHLTRRQNEALARGLAFERDQRTPSVQEFLSGLKDDSRGGLRSWQAGAIATAAIVLLAVLAMPYLERQQMNRILQDLSSAEPDRIETALGELDALDPDQKMQVLNGSRNPLQDYFRSSFSALMSYSDADVPFDQVQALLSKAMSLYPDSAALQDLHAQYQQRKDKYLTDLATRFESYLVPERLIPAPDTDDLHDLLARLELVDPDNALLHDERIPGAYASATEQALAKESYAQARKYLDSGLALEPDDPALSDLRDRIEVIEQRLAREQQIASLEAAVNRQSAAVRSLADLPGLLPTITALTGLESDSRTVRQAGDALAKTLAGEILATQKANDLAGVDRFLAEYGKVWQALGQTGVVDRVAARRAELVERQTELVARARDAIATPDMTAADGDSALELIDRLRTIDPTDTRVAALLAEIAQERRRRSQELAANAQWDAARAELNAALGLDLPTDIQASINGDLDRVNDLEQEARARAQEAERLAAQREEEERQRLAAERLRAQQQLERQRAQTRQAAIDEAAQELAGALKSFAGADLVTAVRQVKDRMAALEALDAANPAIAQAEGTLPGLIEDRIRAIGDTDAALAAVDAVGGIIGPVPTLEKLRSSLVSKRVAEVEAERGARIAAAQRELSAALAKPAALADAEPRRRAERALKDLQPLLADDAPALEAARQRYVGAFLAAAEALIESERFTLARQLIDAAAAQAPRANAVVQANDRLSKAQSDYQAARERQQRSERLEAAQSEFNATLAKPSSLADADARRRVERALNDLEPLLGDDKSALDAARQRYVNALVAAASPLIDAKRFTLAGQLLDAAAKQASSSTAVTQARSRLNTAQAAYQAEREDQQEVARIEALQQRFSYEVSSGQLERAAATLDEYSSARPGTSFARADGPARLADAYAQRAQQQLAESAFSDARKSQAQGLKFAADSRRLLELGRAITSAEVKQGITQWFAGSSNRSLTAVREDIQRYRQTAPDQFASAERAWAQQVKNRLDQLATDPAAYNVLLADAVTLLPESGLLTTLKPLETTPKLALADILGQWCGDDVELELAEDHMQFNIGRQRATYDVDRYSVGADLISVYWRNRNQQLVFEFGEFSPSRSQMVQIRGRQAQSSDWQTYNRSFKRCN